MPTKPVIRAEDLFTGVAHADKYQAKNWIARRLVNNFMSEILAEVQAAGSREVYEVGCGEGHILGILASAGFCVRGCDVSLESLQVARSEAARRGLSIEIAAKSIYDLDPATDKSDTVLCCEVLEHLTDPTAALEKLTSITRKDLIISVPHEPLWRLLNIARGKYLRDLGNTPGHLQHWTKSGFIDFVSQYGAIARVRSPLPWTLIRLRRDF